jgi:schlafen family protein
LLPRRGDRYETADVDRAIAERWTESSTVEYKADPSLNVEDRRRLTLEQKIEIAVAKGTSAFANSGGGTFVLGVGEADGVPVPTTPPGIPRSFGRDRADERVELMISRCIEPRPACRVDFAQIDDTRAYVVVDVAPRGGGPHRVTSTSDPTLNGRFYVRRGRESVEADHFALRALFAEAQEETTRVREYLHGRGFTEDIEAAGFGQREPGRQLSAEQNQRATGAMFVTVIPEVLRGDVLDLDAPELRSLLTTGGNAGWLEERATLEGRMLFRAGSPPLLKAYFHVHRNGYIESGDARIFESTSTGKQVFPHAVAAVLDATFTQAAKLYGAIALRDRLLVGLHLRSVGDSRLAMRGSIPVHTEGYNTQSNITVEETVSLAALALPAIRASFDRRLANAYGLDAGLALNPDGSQRRGPYF